MNKATKSKPRKPRVTRSSKTRIAKPLSPKANAAHKTVAPRERSKIETVVSLLRHKDGAALAELMKATHWQAHSVRGALSGTVKKKLGLKVLSTKSDGVRRYSIKS